jgi:hypothetical protein
MNRETKERIPYAYPKDGTWGLLDRSDPKRRVWLGGEHGPQLYENRFLARCAAAIASEQLGVPIHVDRYTEKANQLVDEVPTKCTPVEAIRRIESRAK